MGYFMNIRTYFLLFFMFFNIIESKYSSLYGMLPSLPSIGEETEYKQETHNNSLASLPPQLLSRLHTIPEEEEEEEEEKNIPTSIHAVATLFDTIKKVDDQKN